VALSSSGGSKPVVLLTSGVHGVEGFVGSAIQIKAFERPPPPGVRFVFVHAINPFGFAHLRRGDQDNVDLNRNFLDEGQPHAGSDPFYENLDPLLNPPSPPGRFDTFSARAFWNIMHYGLPPLRQAIAAGQYDFPKGLFFGGSVPSPVQAIFRENLPHWLGDACRVVHLDVHTGLGPWATHKLLIDPPLTPDQMKHATDWFGPEVLQPSLMDGVAYHSPGGFGPWCAANNSHRDYLFLCAEFGTYHNVKMLAGMRKENRAHYWSNGPSDPRYLRTKAYLKELFCPASPAWRKRVVEDGAELVVRAAEGLRKL